MKHREKSRENQFVGFSSRQVSYTLSTKTSRYQDLGWLVGWLVGEKISQIPSSYCFLFFEKHLNEKLRKYPDALELRKKVEDMGGTSLLNVDATKLHKVLLGFEGKMGGEDENRVSETDVL